MKANMNHKKTSRRSDGVLSPEDLAKAIEEYKARRAKNLGQKTDEEDDPNAPVVNSKPSVGPEPKEDEDDTAKGPDTIEGQVAAIKRPPRQLQDRCR
jgi:hypothetical protein